METLCLLISIFFAYLTDKNGSNTIALNDDAIARREMYNIPIDSLDYAVSSIYIDSLRQLGADILYTSRWLNGVTFRATDSVVSVISKQAFIRSVQKTKVETSQPQYKRQKLPQMNYDDETYTESFLQLSQIGVDKMHEAGYTGRDIRIAVVDNGFLNVDKNPAFDDIRHNIIDTFNLAPNMGGVYEDGDHGAYCLSLMAGNVEGLFIGAAPASNYYLIRSEDDYSESMWEVDNQTRAFEIADSVGADIITSSLGYAQFDDASTDFTYADMNGRVARNSIAATIAARKGILVFIAAGNEGNNDWHYICSPADADSIITVGAVTKDGIHAYFSSYGPSSDGRIKPEVAALGSRVSLIEVNGANIGYGSGTSFATPLIAGMAACLWEALPELNNMQIIKRITDYASQHDNPDNQLGYGIANGWNSLNEEILSVNLQAQNIDQGAQKLFTHGTIFIYREGIKYTILGIKVGD